MKFLSPIKALPAKLFLLSLLFIPLTDAISQTLIITETSKVPSAAISVTQDEPDKMVVCLSKAPNRTLSCYEATGKPMHLTDENSTLYLAKKYEVQIGPKSKNDSGGKTMPNTGDDAAASPDVGNSEMAPDLPAQETGAALRNG